jgi:hypothetical protein
MYDILNQLLGDNMFKMDFGTILVFGGIGFGVYFVYKHGYLTGQNAILTQAAQAKVTAAVATGESDLAKVEAWFKNLFTKAATAAPAPVAAAPVAAPADLSSATAAVVTPEAAPVVETVTPEAKPSILSEAAPEKTEAPVEVKADAEVKPVEPAVAPTYEPFKLPEGVKLDEKPLNEFTGLLGDIESKIAADPVFWNVKGKVMRLV